VVPDDLVHGPIGDGGMSGPLCGRMWENVWWLGIVFYGVVVEHPNMV
jgi:hypothetical protein